MKLQRVRITKSFLFDMAHALFGYDGPCKNIHGHTYQLHVTLKGTPLMEAGNPKLGLVADFGDIKRIVKDKIVNVFDHALVLNNHAGYKHEKLIKEEFEKVIMVPFQPSCELLLLHFLDLLKNAFPANLELVSIILEETPTSKAEWKIEDNG